MNRELFQKIHDVISVSPEKLEMTFWEDSEALCGTTRCIAGWAVSIAAESPIYNPRFVPGLSEPMYTPEVNRLFEQFGLDGYATVPDVARVLLGLDDETAARVFYRFDNELMAEYVKAAAEGDEVRCNEILER